MAAILPGTRIGYGPKSWETLNAGSDERQYNQDSGRFENEPGYRANWAMGYSDCMNRLRDNGQFGGAPVLNTLPARTF
ncbi:MAG: hypothetical protein RJQ08_14610 [Salinisphaeraceae bacterium]